jgi:hypothetical protein
MQLEGHALALLVDRDVGGMPRAFGDEQALRRSLGDALD